MEPVDLDRAEVKISLKCIECGYDVRGLKAGGRCPECGHAVLDTVLCATCRTPANVQLDEPEGIGRQFFLIVAASFIASVMHVVIEAVSVTSWNLGALFPGRLSLRALPGALCLLAALAAMGLRVRLKGSGVKVNAGGLVSGLIMIGVCDVILGIISDPDSRLTWMLTPTIALVLELGIVVGAIMAVLGAAPLLAVLGRFSHRYQSSGAARQGTKAMVNAAIAAGAGHLMILGGTAFPGGESWISQIGGVILLLATIMFTVGLGYLTVNVWWIRTALARPPLRLRNILRPTE